MKPSFQSFGGYHIYKNKNIYIYICVCIAALNRWYLRPYQDRGLLSCPLVHGREGAEARGGEHQCDCLRHLEKYLREGRQSGVGFTV